MDTKIQSTENTEETECLADVGHRSEEFVDNMLFLIKEESGEPPSARRFVTLRASENNVMRKLETISAVRDAEKIQKPSRFVGGRALTCSEDVIWLQGSSSGSGLAAHSRGWSPEPTKSSWGRGCCCSRWRRRTAGSNSRQVLHA